MSKPTELRPGGDGASRWRRRLDIRWLLLAALVVGPSVIAVLLLPTPLAVGPVWSAGFACGFLVFGPARARPPRRPPAPTSPREFVCPRTGRLATQTLVVGMGDITTSDIRGNTTRGSCGHVHRLDSPAGVPGWIVDGNA